MKRYNIVLFTLIVCACSVQAQTVEPITYKQYMHKVSADNLEYAAEKMNVSAAHADVIAAKVFDDPSLSLLIPTMKIILCKWGKAMNWNFRRT